MDNSNAPSLSPSGRKFDESQYYRSSGMIPPQDRMVDVSEPTFDETKEARNEATKRPPQASRKSSYEERLQKKMAVFGGGTKTSRRSAGQRSQRSMDSMDSGDRKMPARTENTSQRFTANRQQRQQQQQQMPYHPQPQQSHRPHQQQPQQRWAEIDDKLPMAERLRLNWENKRKMNAPAIGSSNNRSESSLSLASNNGNQRGSGDQQDSNYNSYTMALQRSQHSDEPRRGLGAGDDMLLHMSHGEQSFGSVDRLARSSEPVTSVARSPQPAHREGLGAAAAAGHSPYATSSKGAAASSSVGAPTPGAYSVQSRAVGALPGWVRRAGPNFAHGVRTMARSMSIASMSMSRSASIYSSDTGEEMEDNQHAIPPELRVQENRGTGSRRSMFQSMASSAAPTRNSDDEYMIAPVVLSQRNLARHDESETTPEEEEKITEYPVSRILIVLLIMMMIGAGIGAGIGVSQQGSSGTPNGAPTTSPPSSAPTACETIDFISQAQQSCICFNTVDGVDDEFVAQYNTLKSDFVGSVLPSFDSEAESCEANNLALYWLAEDIVTNNSPEDAWVDRFLLVSLFISWTGDDPQRWRESISWLTGMSECLWQGVLCGSTGVETLALRFNNLLPGGGLPPELFLMSDLQFIDLSFNELIIPSLPTDFGKFQNLKQLDLESNRLGGLNNLEGLPRDIEMLNLRDTDLGGPIPTTIGEFSTLQRLDLSYASLTGPIPTEIASATTLRILELGGNPDLDSDMPIEIANLTNLERLIMEGNLRLETTIPSEMANLINLVELNFRGTSGRGTLPSEIGMMTSIERLTLAGLNDPARGFRGPIPSQLSQLTKLEWLNLRGNQLSGNIPTELGGLPLLERFDVGLNSLTGTIPSELSLISTIRILRVLGKLPSTASGNDGRNEFVGTIPQAFASFTNLECFDASGTLLTGTVPQGMCDNNEGAFINIRCVGGQTACGECNGPDKCATWP